MIVVFLADNGLRLIEANEFRSFKMVTDTLPAAIPNIEGLRFEGDNIAWIKQDLVRSLLTQPVPQRWHEAFEAMIEKAAKYDWVNAAGEVRAHIEFA